MSKTEKKEHIMLCLIRFQLKIMEITGYTIELGHCVKCLKKSEDEDIYFSTENGGILCGNCAKEISKKIKIPQKIREFLNVLLNEDFSVDTKYDDLVNEKVCSSCINLLKNYIEYYSPKHFKTTEMLEVIK